MGTKVSCLIDEVTNETMSVSIATGVEGEILPLDYDATLLNYDVSKFTPGTMIEASVCSVIHQGYKLALSTHPRCLEPLEIGSQVEGIIVRKPSESSLSDEVAVVQLPGHRQGYLFCTDVTEMKLWKEYPIRSLSMREKKEVTILGNTVFFKDEVLAVTLRHDVLAQQQATIQLKQIVCGFVVNIGMKGLHIR